MSLKMERKAVFLQGRPLVNRECKALIQFPNSTSKEEASLIVSLVCIHVCQPWGCPQPSAHTSLGGMIWAEKGSSSKVPLISYNVVGRVHMWLARNN